MEKTPCPRCKKSFWPYEEHFCRSWECDEPTVGKYTIDYSEPTQAQIDAANAQCADLFKSGEWISVNRESGLMESPNE